MKRTAKGKFGYTLSHRKWQIMKMSLYITLALAVFILGLAVTKTTKNVLCKRVFFLEPSWLS